VGSGDPAAALGLADGRRDDGGDQRGRIRRQGVRCRLSAAAERDHLLSPPGLRDTADERDVLVVGSGSAALSAALTAAQGGLSVTLLEKTELIGGTSAMSGAGTWIPANHHARAVGLADSPEEALTYLRAASPEGWQASEDELWQAFVATAPRLLAFLEQETKLRFALTREPDPLAERPGGKTVGRMLSPLPLSRRLVGPYAAKLRRSTKTHFLTYHEMFVGDAYHQPIRTALRLAPKLFWRLVTGQRGQGSALITGLLEACLRRGCRIELGARAVEFVLEPEGRVAGVVVE